MTELAKDNPRHRQNYDLRNGHNDNSQRMLNALEPCTIIPVHRHRKSSETMIVIKGALKEIFYDDNGNVIGEWICAPNTDCMGMNIPAGQWHYLVCLKVGTVIFEAKDGAWEPLGEEDVLDIIE